MKGIKMKLYIWHFGTKFFCAMAVSQEQARTLLLEKPNCFPEDLKDVADEYEFPVAFAIRNSV